MKPKDIFGLAVRLLGLYFLYLALSAVGQMLSSDVFESPDRGDILTGLWPVLFYLVVAVWLMSGGFLGRLAYPEPRKSILSLSSDAKPASAQPQVASTPESVGMNDPEKKLAALVETPKKFA
jgi:Na+-transporting methylmalonyl-CoA/oxaloacetate decarboxylase gamma subunit